MLKEQNDNLQYSALLKFKLLTRVWTLSIVTVFFKVMRVLDIETNHMIVHR